MGVEAFWRPDLLPHGYASHHRADGRVVLRSPDCTGVAGDIQAPCVPCLCRPCSEDDAVREAVSRAESLLRHPLQAPLRGFTYRVSALPALTLFEQLSSLHAPFWACGTNQVAWTPWSRDRDGDRLAEPDAAGRTWAGWVRGVLESAAAVAAPGGLAEAWRAQRDGLELLRRYVPDADVQPDAPGDGAVWVLVPNPTIWFSSLRGGDPTGTVLFDCWGPACNEDRNAAVAALLAARTWLPLVGAGRRSLCAAVLVSRATAALPGFDHLPRIAARRGDDDAFFEALFGFIDASTMERDTFDGLVEAVRAA